ncbi:sugar phosphate isomerase/epimerase [Bacteroides sp. 224]|uniref:sugar phosphate isomerase/epimerase family protein n=1 Tax=Bacteroides sp. 224 TaxID=2302936 RepID=UPI0013D42691|nr:sugar phosphate isomerase/epimerase [Bacteroides sp. 224]NDV65360.1 sugar phosphate isomerase/epimerase [Bacteroides sp. 224]
MKTKNILVFLLLIAVLPIQNVAAQKKAKKDIAIQLYSVRDLLKDINKNGEASPNYTAILKKLSQMGYTGIEAANYNNGKFYNRTPEEFKKDIEGAGLKVLSSHCGKGLSAQELSSGNFTESLKWWDQCIAAHKAAGMKYIVTPSMETPKTLKDLKTYCDYYNEIGKRCKANGMEYGYHNHAFEYQKIENKVMMDYMIENTNPEYVFFQMDVYWVVMGKCSPVDYFNKYPGRFKVLHVKDHREIGQSGMVGFDAIFNKAKTAGVKDLIVEVEKYSMEIEESIKVSLDYLLKAPFVKNSYSK